MRCGKFNKFIVVLQGCHKLRQTIFAVLTALLFVTTAQAGDFTETKLTPSDAAKGDLFGWSAAMSGTTAIVGAMWEDDKRGAAYVFDTATGKQTAKLTTSDAVVNSRFGRSVAISGTTAIVAAWGWDYPEIVPGGIYLFDTTTGKQTANLTPKDAKTTEFKAISVGISGSTAIVGASENVVGTAFLFDTKTGKQTAKLSADDVVPGDFFGGSVAISGTTAIVGASSHDDSTGAVYVFDTTTGKQTAKLTANDAAKNQYFGSAVAISGTTAIVGAMGNADHGYSTGAAYLFDTTTGKQIAKLTAPNPAQGDTFSFSVAISGNTAIVGANQISINDGSKNGEAFLFDATTGALIAKLTASDGMADDRFGNAVAVSGTTAVVGANGSDKNGKSSGAAYLFHWQ